MPGPIINPISELTDLNLTLWGTIVGPSRTLAVIEDNKIKIQSFYRVGDKIQGAVIAQILKDKIVLTYKQKDYFLLKTPQKKSYETAQAEKTPSNTYEISIDKSLVQSSLNNIEEIRRQVAFRSMKSNDRSQGLLLYRIKSGSVFGKLGLQNGDVLTQINGYPTPSLSETIKIFQTIKSIDQVKILILRKGKEIELSYLVIAGKKDN